MAVRRENVIMLTYDLTAGSGPLYEKLYRSIKEDIRSGVLGSGTKMPSKRALAGNLGISTVTVENAYEQLISEGYIYTCPRRGYYVSDIGSAKVRKEAGGQKEIVEMPAPRQEPVFDFSSNRTENEAFPFSVWAKLMRETISEREKDLMEVSPSGGVRQLREAIADHLASFRGMDVSPEQIIVGAGTEYLYGILIRLLGEDRTYCLENPGYKKLQQVYESSHVRYVLAGMDSGGIRVEDLTRLGADIAHISPTHHFPTGITMPAGRRYELLAWAMEKPERYIIEDDYDSEFRRSGRPVPPLQSMDGAGKVIYMNTFSKSLSATIRISYMVLPALLAGEYYRRLGFSSCTVSTFEQYTLASFISRGYFEKHINRMRLHYERKRTKILSVIRECFSKEECTVIENDSGLHFLMKINTSVPDREVKERFWKEKIRIATITDYETGPDIPNKHLFILNYSSMDPERLREVLIRCKELFF